MKYNIKVNIPNGIEPVEILGVHNNKVRYIKKYFDVEIKYENLNILINSNKKEELKTVEKIIKEVLDVILLKKTIEWSEFIYIVSKQVQKNSMSMKNIVNTTINGVKISAKTEGQAKYIENLKKYDMLFSIGPAGTGKTYLAVAMAVKSLKMGEVQRIILTRPAVEAGEKLGFLPGTLYDKIDPYLKPLYDSLMDFIGTENLIQYKEKGIIEIVPLAYMRGRTLNNSYVILDEAQNSTYQQMKMFLTRIGFNSKVVVTGDITQIDLEKKKESGLLAITKILKDIEEIKITYLNKNDVVRNPMVKKIIQAYEIYENKKEN
ncbi:DEAD/DEAH box helicase [Tepiditoga spiralis]|uniref:PhoH-like protein n=1 Tax=Tepiditoga spiralis TaxID=2108365 RepID=A0A7G1G8X1_9BACT|nr:PhoH family protein [Tepiditoga spiralis]BBE31886.1 DEAD/DEAH box helicase [Tepiditoga spiralis]